MKKSYITTVVLTLGLLGLLTPGASAASICDSTAGNLVTNCGFENGTFAGWTLSGNLQGGVGGNYIYVDNSNPNSGSYAAAMGAPSQYGQTGSGNMYGPDTTLTQDLTGLRPGFYYEVAFFLDNNGCSVSDPGCTGYYNHLDASLGGKLLYSANNLPNSGGAYDEYVFVFDTANDNTYSNALQFDFSNDNDVFYFDDVTVTSLGPTPEPASFLLVTPVLGGLFLFARRRRQAA